MPIPAACTHIPQAIIHFLPTRSESAPVNSWHTPHTAGYVAARTAILSTDRCAAAKKSGKSPHAIPSFRLLTIPAWLQEKRFGSR